MHTIRTSLLLALLTPAALASPAAAQIYGHVAVSSPYQHYRLQHANPYAYGLPRQQFRWGWFGAAPRWDTTHERPQFDWKIHLRPMHQWTHRHSY
jgi:hypothetical protein